MNSMLSGRGLESGRSLCNGTGGSIRSIVGSSSGSFEKCSFGDVSLDYSKLISDDIWKSDAEFKSVIVDTVKKSKNLDEEILNIITSSFGELSKYVIKSCDSIKFKKSCSPPQINSCFSPQNNKSDILMTICRGNEVQNIAYDIENPASLFYVPNLDMITDKRIPELLEGKFKNHISLHKNHEYLMTYIAHHFSNIDCYAFTMLYNKLTEEEKQLYQINLNYLITGINNISKFELIHEIINEVNILENKCLTDAGENLLMMILHNQSTSEVVNDYIKLLSSYIQEGSSTPNSIDLVTAVTDCNKNIFSYANLDYLTVESYKHLINMGYDINSTYKKNGKLTNIIYDLFNSLSENVTKNNNYIVQKQINVLEYLLPLSETCPLINFDMKKSSSSISLDSGVIFKILETISKLVLSLNQENEKNKDNKYNVNILHKLLLNTLRIKNIDINAVDKFNNNILAVLLSYMYELNTSCCALYFEHVINSILENFEDIDVNYRTNDNKILLETIVINGNFELFEKFCNHPMIDFTTLTSQGSNISFLLIDKINEVNENNKKSRYIMTLMNLLNANGFNINSLNHEDKNLVSYMCSKPNTVVNLQIIKKLIEMNIDLTKIDLHGKLAVDYAVENKHWLVRSILV